MGLAGSAAGAAPPESPAWRITSIKAFVTIMPAEGKLSVHADLDVARGDRDSPTLDFFLNRNLRVGDVRVDGKPVSLVLENGMESFPFAPAARLVTAPAPVASAAVPSPAVRLEISYEGTLPAVAGSVSRVSAALTELNLYGGWFPIFEGPQGFEYDLEVQAPPGYRVLTTGRESAPAPGEPPHEGGDMATQRFTGRSSAGDLPVIVSAGLDQVPVPAGSECELQVFSTSLPEGVASEIASEASWACGYFAGRISARAGVSGGKKAPEQRLILIVVPRDDPGYARPPMVVVPAGWFVQPEGRDDDRAAGASWRRKLFHEIAHTFGPLADTGTYDDWINEGLAEFLSLQALAARRGGEAAARFYRKYLLEIASRPPVPPLGRPGPAEPEARDGTAGRGPEAGSATVGGDGDEPPEAAKDAASSRAPLAAISQTERGEPDATLLYYRKGALIFRMIAGLVGDERFRSILTGLRERFPASASARMTTGNLVEALEAGTGDSFAWLWNDWVDGTGLPRLSGAPEFHVRPAPGDRGGEAGPYEVTGTIRQAGGRTFSLRLPMVARRGPREASTIVALSGRRTAVEWDVPFEPAEVDVDPQRLVPRFDETLDLALLLFAARRQEESFIVQGLRAERDHDYGRALDAYNRAAGADPDASLPWYRKGRALAALGRLDLALKAHRTALTLAKKETSDRERIARKCAAGPPMACPEPGAWLDPPLDLRAWAWVRIGQIQDASGRRSRALHAYEAALGEPDRLGAHDKARACEAASCARDLAGPSSGIE